MQIPNRSLAHKRGMALVMVLSCIVLISMLVVSFLMLVRTDQQSSSAFSASAEARLLADIPINITIGQIRRGSEQLGYRQSWASQPGMIRTYGSENDGTNHLARPIGLYKLYSDDKMVVNNQDATYSSGGLNRTTVENEIQQDIDDIADWDTKPGMFADLNEPTPVRHPTTGELNIRFPIVDPRALTPGSSALPVEGFDFSETQVSGVIKPNSNKDVRTRLPMPVKWIYVLKDGTFSTPTSATATSAIFNGTSVPTDDNPIVSRIAFWTDDESTKVNINTASEGTPWYTPFTTNDTDKTYAQRLPAHFEYSRMPGHPAQVSLSPIFQAFDANLAVPAGLSDGNLRSRLEFYHTFNPRLAWAGTMGGTQNSSPNQQPPSRNDRLYVNLDEMLLTTDRQLQNPAFTSEQLALTRFFLTTSSRAPEMTLFNKFRFSLWPNWAGSSERTSIDDIMEFINSSGVRGGGASYQSRGAFNRGLGWSFLRKTSAKLNTNGTLASGSSSQYSTRDPAGSDPSDYSSNMQRLVDGVLDIMTGNPAGGSAGETLIPGFGNTSFRNKYSPAKRDQILISMMDVLRSTVDAYRPVRDNKFSYSPPQNISLNPRRVGEYSVAPLMPEDTGRRRGFGRVPTISELAIVFMATQVDSDNKATEMQAFLIFEPFSPFSGPPAWSPNVYYKIEGLENLRVRIAGTEQPLFPNRNTLVSKANCNPSLMAGGNKSPFNGFFAQFARGDINNYAVRNPAAPAANTKFHFISDPITLNTATDFEFSGGNLKVSVVSGWANPNDVADNNISNTFLHYQGLNIPLAGYGAPGTFRTPPAFRLKAPYILATDGTLYNTLAKRLNQLRSGGNWNPQVLIRRGDIVRSSEASALSNSPAKGDLRVIAALKEVPSNYFTYTGGNSYINSNIEILHDLNCGAFSAAQTPFPNDLNTTTAGNLVRNLTRPPEARPAVPAGLIAALNKDNRPGDWDNGVGEIGDGPYVNRADNGSRWFGPDGGYYGRGGDTVANDSHFDHTFSLHRNAPSAVIFGSIPSGIDPTNPANIDPWQTLLFCPNPASRRTAALGDPTAADHKGFGTPRDHLLLDFFWMPSIQPYAISEALSSAGKINMNYQMLPFTHIERSTGIHAAMKATRVTAISRASASGTNNYKNPSGHNYETRYLINVEETLNGFRHRFDNQHDIFRSASEICEIFLVPERIPGASYAPDVPSIPAYSGMNAWWNGNNPSATSTHAMGLTGDNAREAPYGDLYPKLTTRSNTFQVHYRVQTLTKARSSPANEWVEDRDFVTAEHRGSAVLERYLDPNNHQVASINQGGGNFADSWDGFFRFRIVSRKDFTP